MRYLFGLEGRLEIVRIGTQLAHTEKELTVPEEGAVASTVTPVANRINWPSSILSSTLTIRSPFVSSARRVVSA